MGQESISIESAFRKAWPPAEWRDVHVVLAVSGGCDSVAMLCAALTIKQLAGGRGQLYVAHLNHGWRGAESADDAAWVGQICRRFEIPLEIGRLDGAALSAESGDGWEAAARSARYEFLRDTAERLGARFVAVGHTADDQVETIVHRLVRGTGVAGLSGMPVSRPLSPTVSLVRPLLTISRTQVQHYLDILGQDFREDATNADCRFTRNRIRHELLPWLRAEFNDDVDTALLRLGQQAADVQQVIAELASGLKSACVELSRATNDGDAVLRMQIDSGALANSRPVVVREAIKQAWTEAGWPLQGMGFDQWQQLASMATAWSPARSAMFPGGIRAEQSGHSLTLRR